MLTAVFWIVLSLSALSLIYYCIIINYAGIGLTFSRFWLVVGTGGFLLCLLIKYMLKHDITLEGYLEVLILGVCVLGVVLFVGMESVLIYHGRQKAEPGMDYLIILGAQVRGTVISKALMRRLDTGVDYLKENPNTIAIVSGGKGKKEAITEAQAMEQYLLQKGINKNRILKEDKSTNTFENILFTKSLMKKEASAAIVTNGFHIYRSLQIAKKQGNIKVKGHAAPTDKLLSINYYVREAFGIMKDKIAGNI